MQPRRRRPGGRTPMQPLTNPTPQGQSPTPVAFPGKLVLSDTTPHRTVPMSTARDGQ